MTDAPLNAVQESMIYTDSKGRPVAVKPIRGDFATWEQWRDALYAFNDAVSDAGNRAFDSTFRAAMKRSGR